MSSLLKKIIGILNNGNWRTYSKISAIIMFAYFIYKYRARKHPTIRMRPGYIPIIGHTHYMLGLMPSRDPTKERIDNFKDLMLELNEDCVCTTRFGNWSTVFLFDPKYVKFVFEDRFNDFEKGAAVRDRLFELLGDGIFSSDGEIWRKHRKVGSKMFSMRNLKNYMFQVAKKGNDRWMKKLEQLRTDEDNNNCIDIYNLLSIYTLDVFVEIAFGFNLGIIESIPKPHPFSQAFDNALNTMVWRFRIPFFKVLKSLSLFHEAVIKKNVTEINKFANKMIESVEKDRNGNNKLSSNVGKLTDASGTGKHNILSLFLDDNPNLSRTELRDIAMNFIIAGRDTTRLLLSWFLYELSLPQNATINQKIVAEIDNFYKHEKELTYKNIQNVYSDDSNQNDGHSYFKYLEAALLETLRLHPAVPFLLRFALKDVKLPGPKGHIIKKGQGVALNTYIHGHNTRVWGSNASEFKPERFLEKGLKSFEPHIYPAFNIAPRLCLGRHVAIMEAKLVAIRLLHKYKYQAVKDQKVTKALSFVLNMENGFKIHLYPRN